jgi:hypothetical protein
MNTEYTYQDSFDRKRHGSLYDRGSADSWYSRGKEPHWYPNGTCNEPRIEDLDEAQIAEYNAGFDDNEAIPGARKEW